MYLAVSVLQKDHSHERVDLTASAVSLNTSIFYTFALLELGEDKNDLVQEILRLAMSLIGDKPRKNLYKISPYYCWENLGE